MEQYHLLINMTVSAVVFFFVGHLVDRLLYTAADDKIRRNMILFSTFAYFVSVVLACVTLLKILYILLWYIR